MIATKPTHLFWIEQKLLLATVALSQILPAHTEKLRWAMRELGCHLEVIANFYPTQVDVRFLRVGSTTADQGSNRFVQQNSLFHTNSVV